MAARAKRTKRAAGIRSPPRDLDDVLLDLARVEGEIAHLRHPGAVAAARVLEGVRRCLHHPERPDNAQAMQRCATRLVRAADGDEAESGHPKRDGYGQQAEALRAVVARYLETNKRRDPAFLAEIVDVTARNAPGPLRRLLGGALPDRLSRWARAIGDAFAEPSRQLAEQIVLACARAGGQMKRPADLFGRESKATDRRGGLGDRS